MSVTLGNLGTTSLVGTPSSTTVATKGLVAGTNMSFGTSSTDVTINYPTPICRITNSPAQTGLTSGSNTTLLWNTELLDPTGMHSTSMDTDRVNILQAGNYNIQLSARFAPASTPGGFVLLFIFRVSGMTTSTIGVKGDRITATGNYYWNLNITHDLLASDYVYASFQNVTGVNIDLTAASDYAPIFCVNYVGTS